TALLHRKTLVRFDARIACHSSSWMSSVARITAKPPALLTRTSTRPHLDSTASTASPISAERVTSVRCASTSAPVSSSARATASSPAPSRSSAAIPRAFTREGVDDRGADSLGGAGDDDDLSLHLVEPVLLLELAREIGLRQIAEVLVGEGVELVLEAGAE